MVIKDVLKNSCKVNFAGNLLKPIIITGIVFLCNQWKIMKTVNYTMIYCRHLNGADFVLHIAGGGGGHAPGPPLLLLPARL